MSHGATFGGGGGGARNAAVGGSFRGAAVGGGSSFRSGSQVSRRAFSRGGNRFAGGRNFRGDRRGGVGFGLAAGALAGAALGGYYGGYYGYDDGYYGDSYGPAYAYEGGDDDGAGYCMQRYRSYDPNSGTYLGYDGLRHPCP
jgi:hypothetical protein